MGRTADSDQMLLLDCSPFLLDLVILCSRLKDMLTDFNFIKQKPSFFVWWLSDWDLCFFCLFLPFSLIVSPVSGNGACSHELEERRQPRWHADGRIARHSQAGRDSCQLCLLIHPPLKSVAVTLADIQSLLPAEKIHRFVSISPPVIPQNWVDNPEHC